MNSEQSYASTIRKMGGREHYCRVNSERQHKKYFEMFVSTCSFLCISLFREVTFLLDYDWNCMRRPLLVASYQYWWHLFYESPDSQATSLTWLPSRLSLRQSKAPRRTIAAPQTAQTLTSQRGGTSNMHDRYCSDTTLLLQHILDMWHKW
jgi:hypothetical protein